MRFAPVAFLGVCLACGTALAGGTIHATVETVDGETLSGRILWDGDTRFWDQTLETEIRDVREDRDRGVHFSLFGVRLADSGSSGRTRRVSIPVGDLRSIEPRPGGGALLVTRRGTTVEVEGSGSLGDGLERTEIEDPETGTRRLYWHTIRKVTFRGGPHGPLEDARLYGTVRLTSGKQLTGFVEWDRDESLNSEELDGDDAETGERLAITFDRIREIHRLPDTSRVVFRDGSERILGGTNDVNAHNRGIRVEIAGLGRANLEWEAVASVAFAPAPPSPDRGAFDGGGRLRGVVETKDGKSLRGTIEWDRDETWTWQVLDGDSEGVDYDIPFTEIRALVPRGDAACDVHLAGDRVLTLSGTNDVNESNRGVVVRFESPDGSDTAVVVSWSELARVTFGEPGS